MKEAIQLIDDYIEQGGPGSGHFRHAGVKGKRGGSAPSKAGKSPPTNSTIAEERLHSSLSDKDKGVVRRAVSNLPQEHLDHVFGIASTYLNPGVEGTCEDTYIDLASNKVSNRRVWSKATVVHEVGHAVQHYNRTYGDRSYYSNFLKFYTDRVKQSGAHPAAVKKEATKAGSPRKGFPSRYSQQNHRELFAESYQMYTSAPRTLQSRAPDIYNYMRDKVFDGVEYTK